MAEQVESSRTRSQILVASAILAVFLVSIGFRLLHGGASDVPDAEASGGPGPLTIEPGAGDRHAERLIRELAKPGSAQIVDAEASGGVAPPSDLTLLGPLSTGDAARLLSQLNSYLEDELEALARLQSADESASDIDAKRRRVEQTLAEIQLLETGAYWVFADSLSSVLTANLRIQQAAPRLVISTSQFRTGTGQTVCVSFPIHLPTHPDFGRARESYLAARKRERLAQKINALPQADRAKLLARELGVVVDAAEPPIVAGRQLFGVTLGPRAVLTEHELTIINP